MILRPYQQQILLDLRKSFSSGNKHPLVVAPTGSGKTVVFTFLSSQLAAQGKRVLILVHRVELIRQTVAKLGNCGVISPHYKPTENNIQVASVQTLINRLGTEKYDLIITDECHHHTAGSMYDRIIKHYGCRTIGFTATPIRLDGAPLGHHHDDMILAPSTRELIAMGNLRRPVVYAPSTVDVSAVHKRGGDYIKSEIELIMDRPAIIGDAINHWREYANGLKTVVFCTSRKHSEHTCKAYNDSGIPADYIDGTMSDEVRKQKIDNLKTGRILILTSVDLIGEGFDLPEISCAQLLRPTASESLFLQQVGRAMRPIPESDTCIILDHVGNTLRHGHPVAERSWSLTGTAKQRRESMSVSIKQCERCFFVYEPTDVCPNCGYVNKKNRKEIQKKSGKLHKLTEEEKFERKKLYREQGKCKTLDELKEFARAHGKNPKWAEYVFNARKK